MDRGQRDLSGVQLNHFETEDSDESVLVPGRNYCNCHPGLSISSPHALQEFTSGGQLSDCCAAYFSWPASSQLNDAAEERAEYFGNHYKSAWFTKHGPSPTGNQADTLLDLMTIRAFHSIFLRRFSLGTALGFRIRRGLLTNIPAIIVFVAHKVHKKWLSNRQCLPTALEGPGGVWCDVDVLEFSYYGAPAPAPKEQFYSELVDGLRGSDPTIGSGSQVASHETFGTMGAIVRSKTGKREVGFITNRHVAVDLDYPSQKMFHPLPQNLGSGVYLGAVVRATSYITDECWYGTFVGPNPETFVRADGAFVPFADDFDIATVTTSVKGVGEIDDVHVIDLQSPINSIIGKQVVKVGRSSGLTAGTIMAYALEYNDEKGISFLTDFLVVGENQHTFDLEGDSGSLILLTSGRKQKPQPVGMIWGGTANRGRLKLKAGQSPVNWTSGVDLSRLLNVLNLNLILTDDNLKVAVLEQKNVGVKFMVGGGCQTRRGNRESCEFDIEQIHGEDIHESVPLTPFLSAEFQIERLISASPHVEYQFIHTSASGCLAGRQEGPELEGNSDEDISTLLQLEGPDQKKPRLNVLPRNAKEVGQ